MMRSTVLLVLGCLLSPTWSGCAQQPVPAPEVAQMVLKVVVVSGAGAPVPAAGDVVKVLSRSDTLNVILRRSGKTDDAGAYLLQEVEYVGGWYPASIEVSPPAGSGLQAATVRDSVQFVDRDPVVHVVQVVLSP